MATRYPSSSTYQRAWGLPVACRRAAAVLLLGWLLAAVPAGAATPATSSLLIAGAGDGHGVGLSQDGALGYAEHGYTYQQILAHYYTATALGTAPQNATVRVLLSGGVSRLSVTGASQVNGRRLSARGDYAITASGSELALRSRGHPGIRAARLVLRGSAPLHVGGLGGAASAAYRGALELLPGTGGIEVINVLGLDDYTRGVVAEEASASWPAAALEAQAVASRGYALTSHEQPGPSGFDVYADTRSQVYGGVAAETASTNAAVAATAGQVVTYAGKPVTTYFFASSGGFTENVEDAWPGAAPEPWLRGVPDPYDGGPLHRWSRTLSFAAVAGSLSGLVNGAFEGIEVLKRGYSPRIVTAEVLGSAGNTRVSGDDLAARLGLPATWAYFSVSANGHTRAEPDLSSLPTPPSSTPTTPPAPSAPAAPPAPTPAGGTPAG